AVAIVLDAFLPLAGRPGFPAITWLDLAGLACLGWAVVATGVTRRNEWSTPIDAYVVSGLVLAAVQVLASGGTPAALTGFRQMAAAGGCFYALAARLRRDPRAPDAVWPAFAVALLLLTGCALGAATQGGASLRAATGIVDGRWGSAHGFARALLLLTLLCAG